MTPGEIQKHILNGLYHFNIPGYMHEGIICYVIQGRPVGDFLRMVLSGDLFGALRHADDRNGTMLWEYGRFLISYVPENCFGSPERYRDWVATGGLSGRVGGVPEDTRKEET